MARSFSKERIYVFLYQNLKVYSCSKVSAKTVIYVFLYQNLKTKLTKPTLTNPLIYVFLYQNLKASNKHSGQCITSYLCISILEFKDPNDIVLDPFMGIYVFLYQNLKLAHCQYFLLVYSIYVFLYQNLKGSKPS